MAHLGSCPSDVFRGRGPCLLCDMFRRVVGICMVARVSVGVILLVSSASRAPLSQGRARFSCPRAASVARGW